MIDVMVEMFIQLWRHYQILNIIVCIIAADIQICDCPSFNITTVDGLVLVAFAPTYPSLQTEFINRSSVAQLVRALDAISIGSGIVSLSIHSFFINGFVCSMSVSRDNPIL